jgi:hypothetical protein
MNSVYRVPSRASIENVAETPEFATTARIVRPNELLIEFFTKAIDNMIGSPDEAQRRCSAHKLVDLNAVAN